MESVFLLWYVYAPDSDDEDEMLIGVYSTEQEASAAVERLKNQKGFIEDPRGFGIHRYELNKDHWTDGFIID
jgi:homoserine kinase type II